VALAYNVMIQADVDLDPPPFLWAWEGACATVPTQLSRVSEVRRTIELPPVEPRPVRPTDTDHLSSSTAALRHGTAMCDADLAALRSQADTIAQYQRELTRIGDCISQAMAQKSTPSDLLPDDVKVIDDRIAATRLYIDSLSPGDCDRRADSEARLRKLEQEKAAAQHKSSRVLEDLETWQSLSKTASEKEMRTIEKSKNDVLTDVRNAIDKLGGLVGGIGVSS
ncbi:hypothetical protein AC579_3241, partial [Pseudocercospora musae]